jgi:subtilisin family serine protease
MTKQWRALLLGAAILARATGAAAADDPFLKSRQGRLSHDMNVLALAAEGERVPGVRAAGLGRPSAAGMVTAVVEMEHASDAAALTARVESLGGRVVKAVDHLLKVQVPARSLRALGESAGVARVRAPFRPSTKEVVSQGVATTHAREYSARTGATGAGVRVAVLDGGFARAVDLAGTELPADTAATDFVRERLGSYTGVHGTACAEIVHDMAPDAEIVLAGFEDDVTWSAAIDEIVAAGVRIVSHSIGFDNLFPSDGNNYYTQKVDQAAAAGVLFVSAAGNEGQKYWSGGWRDTNANGFLEFGGTELLPVGAVAPGSRVVLRWDDTFGASNHDYDLLIVTEAFLGNPTLSRDNPAIVAASADFQNGAGNPREIAEFEVSSDQVLYAVVWHDPGSPLQPAQRFWIWATDGVSPQFAVPAGSLTMPGDARGALTVGAVDFASGAVESFSSRGPTHDGRVKPDIAAPDRVATAAYDGQPFAGTSAATPHVAGAAALLLSRNPGMGMAELRAQLESATSSGGRTKNNDTGAGVMDLNLLR